MEEFDTLDDLAKDLRDNKLKPPQCENCPDIGECAECKKRKKCLLLFAHNRVGKTRLSMAFKNLGKDGLNRDTLYFNAFTEDLFPWYNDLPHDKNRYLKMTKSRFFDNFNNPNIMSKIRSRTLKNLKRYANFGAYIRPHYNKIIFYIRDNNHNRTKDIKISRGEQNIFIWCVFLAIVDLVLDNNENYRHINYIYIDDPISSLDDGNTIAVACDLASLLKRKANKREIKTVISSHHGLFFNVLCHELESADRYTLKKDKEPTKYYLKKMGKKPVPYHLAMLKELDDILDNNKPLYSYHFNILRGVLETTAIFLGLDGFPECLDENNKQKHKRALGFLSHSNYPVYEPIGMKQEEKDVFKEIFNDFKEKYKFKLK